MGGEGGACSLGSEADPRRAPSPCARTEDLAENLSRSRRAAQWVVVVVVVVVVVGCAVGEVEW